MEHYWNESLIRIYKVTASSPLHSLSLSQSISLHFLVLRAALANVTLPKAFLHLPRGERSVGVLQSAQSWGRQVSVKASFPEKPDGASWVCRYSEGRATLQVQYSPKRRLVLQRMSK